MFDRTMKRLAQVSFSPRTIDTPRPPSPPPPRVTVVVPCYNYGRYLPACVASILDQPDVAADVIIVDDASPDGSADVARRLAAADTRVQAICQPVNRGHIATYNEGLAQVEGEYVLLLSADDLLTPGALGRATSLMRSHPSVGLAYGNAVAFLGDNEPPPARTEASSWTIWKGHDWIRDRCLTGRNALRSPEGIMRTAVLREVGGYRPELPQAGDFEMWMRAAAVSDVGHVGGVDQAFYRVHDNNMHSSVFAVFEAKGIMFELRQRRESFDSVLPGLPDAEALRSTAYRSLARGALVLAIRAHHWGQADVWPVGELAEFARDLCPPEQLARLWRALDRRRQVGAERSRFYLPFQPRKQLHKVNAEMEIWRQRQAGV